MTLKLCELRGAKLEHWVDRVGLDSPVSKHPFTNASSSIRNSLERWLGQRRWEHWKDHSHDYLQWSDEVMIERLEAYTHKVATELKEALDR